MAGVRKPGDTLIVERGRPRNLVICCPCGCGEKFPVNLDERVGPAWRLWQNQRPSWTTVFPSVWRDTGCRSHFIIWRGSILLFDSDRQPDGPALTTEEHQQNAREIVARLRGRGFVAGESLAQEMGMDPWDVFSTCNLLSQQGLIAEGRGRRKSQYRLK
jgi:hypothetical protein